MVRSRSSAATTARASRPSPTTQQIAPVAADLELLARPQIHGPKAVHRRRQRAASSRPAKRSMRAEARGSLTRYEVAIRAIAATVLTVACALTDAQYPRRR